MAPDGASETMYLALSPTSLDDLDSSSYYDNKIGAK